MTPSDSDGLFEDNPKEKLRVRNEEADRADDVSLSVDDVRQGHTGDHVRYILGLSIVGALIAMAGAVAVFTN